MSVIWSGITEEGAVVPVQVTAEGKVVATGDGPQGDYLPITGGELTGDLEVDGSITATGVLQVDGSLDNQYALRLKNSSPTNPSGVLIDLPGTAAYDIPALRIKVNGGVDAIFMGADGSVTAAGNIVTGGVDSSSSSSTGAKIGPNGQVSLQANKNLNIFEVYQGTNRTIKFGSSGSASFSDDVVVGSRGSQWLIRESNGVAMLIEQTTRGQIEPRMPEKVRDLPTELDLIEAALSEVMDKLKMVPPAGWPVWDGNSETVTTTDNDNA